MRREKCPAYGKICKTCGKKNHYSEICKTKKLSEIFEEESDEDFLFNTEESASCVNAFSIDHYQYNKISDTWIRKPSSLQPFIKLRISTNKDDYAEMGCSLKKSESSCVLPVMADTGCQSCVAGVKILTELNLSESDLIPVSMKMSAANTKPINILGAAILRYEGTDSDGNILQSRQITYITDNSEKVFLSKEACQDLGIISDCFPRIGESVLKTATSEINETCSCPRRMAPPPLPTELPVPATEENREVLKKYLLDHYKSSTFNICSHQNLPMMSGPPMKLNIDLSAEPKAYHTPIPVPLHWQKEVKAGLDQDVNLGVIEPVPIGEPVTWCHRMVVCPKKNGKPRRTVDFQSLNAHATRETHHTQSPFHQARSVPANMKKTVFDAWNGYHSVPIREQDRHLTTFITPWGRYRYCVAPQGYIASGDAYSRRYDEIVSEIPNKTKCIDDTIMWSQNLEESFFQAVNWLDTCGRHGIILNPDKFVFAQNSVEFAGFQISKDTVRPADKYHQAIREFPTPRNLTDMRSWFGLLNQVSYSFSMAKELLPFRELLKPSKKFEWNEDLDKLFETSKEIIIEQIKHGVQIFDKNKPTRLSTDWSKSGIGFWLCQKHCKCPGNNTACCKDGWKICLVGSRFTHAAESRYAPIEGEALAVVEALDKSRHFVLGCKNLTIAVDHKPLLKIFSDRCLDDIPNTRLRNLKEKTLRYQFKILYVPGATQKAADAMSRYPSGNKMPTKLYLEDDTTAIETCNSETLSIDEALTARHISTLNSIESVNWERVRSSTLNDVDMKCLIEIIENGMPHEKEKLPKNLHAYHQYRNELYTVDNVILRKNRIVIPPKLRPEILRSLHSAHQGVTSMNARADSSIFWPGISRDISNLRMSCQSCNRMAPSQPSCPPYLPTLPDYPFQRICADYFHFKCNQYLVIVDRYSNWITIEKSDNGSHGLIKTLRHIFATYGIPDELSSDGGPEFTSSDTQEFLRNWGVHHRLSSVAYPHSNCRAEIGVKSAKRMISNNVGRNGCLNTDNYHKALLQYHNTPDPQTKVSPAMCVYGRVIKDFIPTIPGKYKPHPSWQKTLNLREDALKVRHLKKSEDWLRGTKKLPPLKVGDSVWVQNQTGKDPNKWDKTAIVVEVRQFDQYVVKIDGSQRMTVRNRKFLRKLEPFQPRKRCVVLGDQHVGIPWVLPHPTFPSEALPTPPLPSSNEPTQALPPVPNQEAPNEIRRSTRNKKQPDYLSAYVR